MDVLEPTASPNGVGSAHGAVFLSHTSGVIPSGDPPPLSKSSWFDVVLPKSDFEDAPTVVSTPCPHAVQRCFEHEDSIADLGALKLAQNAHLATMSRVVSKEQVISSTPPGQDQDVAKGLFKDVKDPANSFAAPQDSVVAPFYMMWSCGQFALLDVSVASIVLLKAGWCSFAGLNCPVVMALTNLATGFAQIGFLAGLDTNFNLKAERLADLECHSFYPGWNVS
ncbi:hypothetical protein Nepgr_033683 [Nepenthes gracilis]|uniref:Uncharacterized protein n=1 Tax=Nepenthes gracilis TaxID=150966 RepID=A0AAD3TM93_NEPGR|nr:hypothetical protein Nepgr_033683 [Nepenthes gracilis]